MNKYEIKVYNRFIEVSKEIFRSWPGERKLNGEPFIGDVYYFLSDQIYSQINSKDLDK